MLFCAGLLAAGQFAKIALTLPVTAEALGRSATATAFLVSSVSLTGIALGAVAGALVARIGARRALVAAALGGAALSLAQALLPAYPLFLALRVAEGACHLGIVVAAPTLMARLASDRHRPAVMGLWGMFFGVAFALAAPLVPALLARGGLPLVFAAHGGALAAMAALMALVLPPDAGAPAMPRRSYMAIHRALYAAPRLAAPALGFVWHTLTYVALLTFLPPILGAGAGFWLPVASMAGTFGAGVLSARFAPQRVAMVSFTATIALGAALWAAPEAMLFPVALALFVSLGVIPGASFASVPYLNREGEAQARANGAIAQLGNVGTAAGTPLYALAMTAGPGALPVLTMVLAACGLLSLTLIRARIRAQT